MSSQKRISVAHHSLDMMYSISLFDMMGDIRVLIDFRDFTSSILIGFVQNKYLILLINIPFHSIKVLGDDQSYHI